MLTRRHFLRGLAASVALAPLATRLEAATPAPAAEPLKGAAQFITDHGGRVYDVRSFGARGDDSNPDSVGIRKARDAASLAGGGVVAHPLGALGWSTGRPFVVRPGVVLTNVRLSAAAPMESLAVDAGDARLLRSLLRTSPESGLWAREI